jgi:signal recognition particle subunit SRP54
MEQLRVLGQQIGVDVHIEETNSNPVKIAGNAIERAKKEGYGVVIIDTAGRLAIDEAMMTEITAIKKAVKPTETLFVVDSMTGQDAVDTARTFHERCSSMRSPYQTRWGYPRGAALSIRAVVRNPSNCKYR